MGCGLYYDFIWAWKSGKNPSAKRETNKRIIPNIYVFFSYFLRAGSLSLNKTIPKVTRIPIAIFLKPSFNFLSFTLEQRTPTKITERMLHDLNIMTTGKLVR